MAETNITTRDTAHSHVFLGAGHENAERRTWAVIWLCGVMMVLEISGGIAFGSIALIADGLHMSTHAGALLLAALAYTYSRKHSNDPRFTFGTGKLGDLAGFTSAIVLAMIALLIGYESVSRLFAPVPIRFGEAIPIAALGLLVNIGSAWLLGAGGSHHHDHGHGGDEHGGHDEEHRIETGTGALFLTVFEEGVPPVFRIRSKQELPLRTESMTVQTVRPGGAVQVFVMADRGGYWESTTDVPEPHAFVANICVGGTSYPVVFEEHQHGPSAAHRDNNMRAAVVHVVADAAVSVMVIAGLLLARAFGWLWMDSLAGIFGACVIASWAYGLVRDTGAILLDMNPDKKTAENLRAAIEQGGDRLVDLHLWRLGPGHLGAILSVATAHQRGVDFYRARLGQFRTLSHVTIEVLPG